MGWFEAIMLFTSIAISAINASTSGSGQPELPGYTPPDYEPLAEQSAFAKYQDKTRNTLLNQYYGGTMGRGGRPVFGGEKPSKQFRADQTKEMESSAAGFSPDLAKYYADRGIKDTKQQVRGAQAELNKGYEQRARDINAKSHDIYALTLGSLFGEVSDAGAQSAQLTGLVGQASQMENSRRDQQYAQAMNKWQYDQSQPTTLGTIGGLLPYIGMLASGISGSGTGTGISAAGLASQGGASFNPNTAGAGQYDTSYFGKSPYTQPWISY